MTAKEYFNKIWHFFDNHTGDGESILLSKASEQRGIDILQEYADQETERLKSELDKIKLKCDIENTFRQVYEQKLEEFYEKHKKDVEQAYIDGYETGDDSTFHNEKYNRIKLYAEQYYNQKFKLND